MYSYAPRWDTLEDMPSQLRVGIKKVNVTVA